LAAATLGIEVLEVHVTMSREMFGPDVTSSVTTSELTQLVTGTRFIETMRENPVNKDDLAGGMDAMRSSFTKSVCARVDLPEQTVLREEHLTAKKPGTGIPASRLPEIVNRRLVRAVPANTFLSEEDFA
jgi:N-acetylneuraminate synthase